MIKAKKKVFFVLTYVYVQILLIFPIFFGPNIISQGQSGTSNLRMTTRECPNSQRSWPTTAVAPTWGP
jgi:hypothetical protein